ncbi:MAG TPA: AIR synthase-related protein, partial [Candidatus Binataceae bacterium]
QFVRGVEGLHDASIAFGAPVVSGNVSFYNETEGRAIPPTPTIAVLGVMTDVSKHLTPFFMTPGDLIMMVRTAPPALAASEFMSMFGGRDGGLPNIDLKRENALIQGLVGAVSGGLVESAHDISEGGLAIALVESCFSPDGIVGAELDGAKHGLIGEVELFGEGPSTVLLSLKEANRASVERIFSSAGLECRVVGRVTAEPRLMIAPVIDEDVNELRRIYEDALPGRLRAHE